MVYADTSPMCLVGNKKKKKGGRRERKKNRGKGKEREKERTPPRVQWVDPMGDSCVTVSDLTHV